MLADCPVHFSNEVGIARVYAGQPQALHRLGIGGDDLRGDCHLVAVGRQQRGDHVDAGVVAASAVLGRGGDRRRQPGAKLVDGLVVADLTKMSRPQLEKYLGKEGAMGFLAAHQPKKQLM